MALHSCGGFHRGTSILTRTSTNGARPRAAFLDDRDGDPMSVYRQDIINSEHDDVRRVMTGHQDYALASVTARQVRSRSQTVFPEPLPEESSHTKICGPKPPAVRRWFAKQAEWVIPPPGK